MIASRRQSARPAPGSEHGLPTAAVGRFVASADRPPPWTGLPPEPSTAASPSAPSCPPRRCAPAWTTRAASRPSRTPEIR